MNRKILRVLLKIYAFPMNFFLKIMGEKGQRVLKSEFFKQLYVGNNYSLISFYPKTIQDPLIKGTNYDFRNTAIVIQGPIILKDNFTINTVKMYKQYYNNVKIIISSWKDTEREMVRRLEKEGAYVVLNEYPKFNGYGNINYQIASTVSGIKEAQKLGAHYIMKTRADQRLYNPCALALLMGAYQNGKIVMLGGIANSCYARSFYISDFITFGSVDDMLILYGCDQSSADDKKLLERNKKATKFNEFVKLVNEAEKNCNAEIPSEYDDAPVRYACAEIILAYNYFKQKHASDKHMSPKEAYDEFLRDDVVIVDADSLGFYWVKYDHQVFRQTWFDRLGKLDAGKWNSVLLEE